MRNFKIEEIHEIGAIWVSQQRIETLEVLRWKLKMGKAEFKDTLRRMKMLGKAMEPNDIPI